jgi:DNA-binding transcriptional ArsR family regulator
MAPQDDAARALARRELGCSLQDLATDTGLSKSSIQNALRRLRRRRLVETRRDGPTSPCFYRVLEPWAGCTSRGRLHAS